MGWHYGRLEFQPVPEIQKSADAAGGGLGHARRGEAAGDRGGHRLRSRQQHGRFAQDFPGCRAARYRQLAGYDRAGPAGAPGSAVPPVRCAGAGGPIRSPVLQCVSAVDSRPRVADPRADG